MAGARRDSAGLDPSPGLWVHLCAALAAWLLPLRRRPPTGQPRILARILVLRPDDRVGNALLTVPLVRALQAALPGAQVDLLLAARRAMVVAGLPGITVVPFDKQDAFRRPLRFLRALRALRSRGYDASVDAAHWHAFSLTSALLARLAGGSAVVGHDRGPRALYSAVVPPPAPGTAEVAAKLSLLTGLGLVPSPTPPPLETALGRSAAAGPWADAALAAFPAGRFAALNPGGRKADHRWPPARLGELARGLRARHQLGSLVIWGPGEEALADAVVEASDGAARRAPASDLEQLAALLRRAALVVTNDTGPMHLAVACGAPVLALLLSADGARWSHPGPRFAGVPVGGGDGPAPPGEQERVLEAAGCLLGTAAVPGG